MMALRITAIVVGILGCAVGTFSIWWFRTKILPALQHDVVRATVMQLNEIPWAVWMEDGKVKGQWRSLMLEDLVMVPLLDVATFATTLGDSLTLPEFSAMLAAMDADVKKVKLNA